jgi:murein DD-endopeptidase MepM/ murein hydrolase activator NlpD
METPCTCTSNFNVVRDNKVSFIQPNGKPNLSTLDIHGGLDLAIKKNNRLYPVSDTSIVVFKFDLYNPKYRTKGMHTAGRCIWVASKIPFEMNGSLIPGGENSWKWYKFRYLHMDRIDVNLGQWVDINTRLGLSGDTGYSFGDHLHIDMRHADEPFLSFPFNNIPVVVDIGLVFRNAGLNDPQYITGL